MDKSAFRGDEKKEGADIELFLYWGWEYLFPNEVWRKLRRNNSTTTTIVYQLRFLIVPCCWMLVVLRGREIMCSPSRQ